MAELVDAFAIPDEWLACAALREEPGRQEVMADHDLLTASPEPVTSAS